MNLLLKHLKQRQELSRLLSLLVVLGVVRLCSYLNLHLSESGGEGLPLSQKWFSMAKMLFVKLLSASLLIFVLQGLFCWFVFSFLICLLGFFCGWFCFFLSLKAAKP